MSDSKLERVLYVEDDADIRTVAEMALEIVGGLSLRVCSSGAQALQVSDEFKPDLLLLDVMMPGMDGPTTLAGLRELPQTASTPVIFMTAKVQASEVAYYKSLGALGVIAKPFDPMGLAEEVRTLWEKNNEINAKKNHHANESGIHSQVQSAEKGLCCKFIPSPGSNRQSMARCHDAARG